MKLVRRARKSIRERRMKACINDLQSNLSKVETRLFRAQKRATEEVRRARGLSAPVPRDVLAGKMTPALYAIECRLHREAGLPRPPPYAGYTRDTVIAHQQQQSVHRIGLVDFRAIVTAVRAATRHRLPPRRGAGSQ